MGKRAKNSKGEEKRKRWRELFELQLTPHFPEKPPSPETAGLAALYFSTFRALRRQEIAALSRTNSRIRKA